MAFSRKSMVASVAGSLSLAMLTGCPAAAPTQPSTSPSTAPAASATPAAGTSATPAPTGSASATTGSPSPTASGSPGASATPTTPASAPPPTGKTTIVSGKVYDETGATVDGATIKVNSLDPSVPYTATTTTQGGSWVVNNVPEGANVEIIATRDSWTTRRRVGSFLSSSSTGGVQQPNTVDFGGTSDAAGVAYFISKFPEVASVSPDYDANNVDPTTVNYKLTLSEPLDSTNQTRFANAIRLFPANSYAAPDNDSYAYANPASQPAGAGVNTAIGASQGFSSTAANNTGYTGANYADLKDQKVWAANFSVDRVVDPDTNAGYSLAAGSTTQGHPIEGVASAALSTGYSNVPYDYSIKNGTLFLNDANTRASVTWDATGTVATLTFNAPLNSDRTNQARYQVGLVSTSTTDKIVDKNNNQLGVANQANPTMSGYPSVVGILLHATIKDPSLSLSAIGGTNQPALTALNRWIATHQDAARFAVNVDTLNPTLVSVAYTKNISKSSRLELTFNKPMAAYNGRSGGHVGQTILDGTVINKITFAVSDRTGGTANVNLKGQSVGWALDFANTGNAFGAAGTGGVSGPDIEKETAFASLVSANTSNMGGTLVSGAGSPFSTPISTTVGTDFLSYGTDYKTAETTPGGFKYLLQVNSTNPRTLFLYFINRSTIFDSRVVELKVRAEGVYDPAGNSIKSADADKNQVTTSVQ